MAQFYDLLGEKKTRGIRLAVMDMWKPFRNETRAHSPQAAILFNNFYVMRHLGEALDKVRKAEYKRLAGKNRSFHPGPTPARRSISAMARPPLMIPEC